MSSHPPHPQTRSSELHSHSPLTIKTSNQYESSTRNITSSPRHASASPVQRYSPNNAYISTATHRIGSPVTSTLNKVGMHVDTPNAGSELTLVYF